MLHGTIHVARSRNRKHGGWNMYIGGKRVKNRSKPGALNLSTYDSYFENNSTEYWSSDIIFEHERSCSTLVENQGAYQSTQGDIGL